MQVVTPSVLVLKCSLIFTWRSCLLKRAQQFLIHKRWPADVRLFITPSHPDEQKIWKTNSFPYCSSAWAWQLLTNLMVSQNFANIVSYSNLLSFHAYRDFLHLCECFVVLRCAVNLFPLRFKRFPWLCATVLVRGLHHGASYTQRVHPARRGR